ncbi:hypothetical protein MSAN_01145700 [Mycena sanguinolenta]|uniref:Transmembrane protein n=1 Tax=Mycena sanguinolenta TaxID=230812 RepID=A0A8H6YLC2_9AGAR|nr:hypothetical protein MSAN_01145700 [Mycena sanguinolenta]
MRMNSDNDPAFRTRWRGHLSGLEQRYALPAKQFLQESYEERPLATTAMVLFVASSFVPVVVAAALAAFTICFAVAAALVILLGLALFLTVVLSSALFHSTVITLLGAGALRLMRSHGGWNSFKAFFDTSRSTMSDAPSETSNSSPTPARDNSPAGPPMANSGKNILPSNLLPLLTHGSRKLALLAFILACKAISLLTSPRAVRHKRVSYRTPLWRTPLQLRPRFVRSPPAAAHARLPVRHARVPTHPPCFTILVPIVRGMIRLSSAILRSESVAQLRAGLMRVWAAVALTVEQWVREVLATVVAVLRTELERWEAAAASASNLQPGSVHMETAAESEASIKHTPQPEDTEAYEMVSPVVVAGTSTSDLGEMSTLRARKISGGSED